MSADAERVMPVANLQEFFRDSLHGALLRQHVAVEDQTEHYVVNLLTLFARSEALYEGPPGCVHLKPLVVMLCEALEAPTPAERNRGLQRLGDVSLFVAGFFAPSFAARLIDIDYHIAMGGCAYGALAHSIARGCGRVLRAARAPRGQADARRRRQRARALKPHAAVAPAGAHRRHLRRTRRLRRLR